MKAKQFSLLISSFFLIFLNAGSTASFNKSGKNDFNNNKILEMKNEKMIHNVFKTYVDLWNKHDMPGWGKLFTADTDFITWSGVRFKSNRENIDNHQKAHEILKEQGQNMTYKLTLYDIGYIGNDVALVHAGWEWSDFKTDKGNENRTGILTMLMIKEHESWLIRATQNTRTDKIPK
ncbi:SgcJ/EcaC family oxidoreductase [Sinomicrobium weinanense]|uniref:SgcJ/EcaC family oxidoreductase n=1 Tax=Sinomicrobium weinanense TaxID=2842200 RepID=A0A926JNR6_9FLAO|nr:SgcJ/EcaC family oxidoreductase [Sinomicrobium weinanense]MBC9794685.1 SgcJ/EcaC family oxidoreductase [Sinomicrobium weinanense]MBU3124170.1 SgcJ/EcaC family oxidoreductase [Sinomicrobium weinanense]